ncbi:MAG: DUF4091 domain-containing protein [Gammaproteobacteria bacterium]|nr:DUF4091 domain-containing protein [Gammaproteobacteria bacterium]
MNNTSRLFRTVLLIITVFIVIAAVLYLQNKPRDGIWQFNFAPESAPDVEAFISISAESTYNDWRGYGWADADGPLETGKWPGDKHDTWESRRNLNVVSRHGPDDLARSYATGPATFVLDLAPGKYEVWILSGDAGHLEHLPYAPYSITVEGQTAYAFDITAAGFIKQFEMPVFEDQLSHADIWRTDIQPRFRWSRVVVNVADGQLTVRVDSDRRDNSSLDLIGEYAHSEIRSGPPIRFTGALNALIVLPATLDVSIGEQAIDAIDNWRQQNISQQWPLIETQEESIANLTAADHMRGYTIFPVNVLRPVNPDDRYPHSVLPIELKATPGEYVPVTFAITPLKGLGETRVEFNALQNLSNTDEYPISTERNLVSGVVRYIPRTMDKHKKKWQPGPGMVVPTTHWNIQDGVSKQFWLTWQVPDDMPPGQYRGSIEIKPAHAVSTRVTMEIQVLPFRLQRPTQLAIGMTYFSPVQYAATSEADFWKRMQAEFADMRAHNMTTVQYTGIRMDDYDRVDRAFNLYREAGFEQPVNLLESYGAMWRWRRRGIQWESDEFQAHYVQFVRDFLEQAQHRQWPPVIIDFGDEFTNSATEELGAKIARRLKEIPGIVTAADSNGYKEVELMAPEVDIVAFNNGWDGPEGVNKGKKLLNKSTVDLILNAGAIPWLVNIGMDRFSNGYWFWKMIRLGVRGKMEWMYRGYNGMPYNSFDAKPMRSHAVYPGQNGTAIPSLGYEWMRIGLDDLAYLYTLEQVLEHARNDPEKAAAVAAAEVFINGLDDMIEDDMNKYYDGTVSENHQWTVERYDEVRTKVIDQILQLYDLQDVN